MSRENHPVAWQATMQMQRGGLHFDIELDGSTGVTAVVGPNGSGKTSLLRALVGALRAERAEITLSDRTLVSTAQGIALPMETRRIGYVPQGYGLFPHLRVLDNVAFGLGIRGQPLTRRERQGRAQAMLAELGCAHLADRTVQQLSGGEQQRIALARALVLEPELLLLDEPLAALDAITRRHVRGFLAERLAAFGRPTVLVTHDVNDVIAFKADVCVLEKGRIVQRGTLDALRAQPASAFVSEFLATP